MLILNVIHFTSKGGALGGSSALKVKCFPLFISDFEASVVVLVLL